jgi:uncharacterized protein (DUF362 family)
MDRRRFLREGARLGLGCVLYPALRPLAALAAEPAAPVYVAAGDDPAQLLRRAVTAAGGMGKYVSRDAVVVIKPNIGWDRTPEFAANTNPFVVEELARLCLAAGAKKVKILDHTCNDPRRCYESSGINAVGRRLNAAAKGELVEVQQLSERKFVKMKIGGERLKSWEVYREVVECDVLINAPIAKHHGLGGLTLGLKNWFGAVGGMRGLLHQEIHQVVVDLGRFFKPKLTVIDGYRILLRNGPQGGKLSDVEAAHRVAVASDMVAAEAFGADLFRGRIARPAAIALAEAQQLGRAEYRAVNA